MHGPVVYIKEVLRFARDLSLEKSENSYLWFQLGLLHSLSYSLKVLSKFVESKEGWRKNIAFSLLPFSSKQDYMLKNCWDG